MTETTYFEKSLELSQTGIPFVTVTMIATRGHAPQDPGAKAIVTENGLAWGTVGGGKVEAKAIEYSKSLITNKESAGESVQLLTWNLQRDVGMSCGGEVQFLFERFNTSTWTIAVFGAGHVAQELVRLLIALDCRVLCIDNRSDWMEKLPKESKKLTRVPVHEYSDALPSLPKDAYCVVTTRGHATDLPVLHAILKSGVPPYLGVIGSKVKGLKIRADLEALGISSELTRQIRCPMGIDISNSNHPAEIAVSIVAELIQTRRGSEKPLSET